MFLHPAAPLQIKFKLFEASAVISKLSHAPALQVTVDSPLRIVTAFFWFFCFNYNIHKKKTKNKKKRNNYMCLYKLKHPCNSQNVCQCLMHQH